jgi:DtxR family Mn-dependent transcriptional regulator
MEKIEKKLKEIPESQQRYLDAIHLISKKPGKKAGWVSNTEIAEFLNVKPSSVTNMLHQLKEADLLSWAPRKGIRLTQEGKKVALRLQEIHKLLKQFFLKILKIENEDAVDQLACEIEHHIFNQNEEVYQNLKNLIKKSSKILSCMDSLSKSD